MKLIIVLLFLLYEICESAKILYIMPSTSKSHYLSLREIALELANRGHEVYAITAFEEKQHPPNYHQIVIENISIWSTQKRLPKISELVDISFEYAMVYFLLSADLLCESVFNSTAVQDFMKEDHKFDVVINEVSASDALYIFAHKYKAPLILITTFGNSMRSNYFSRNPLQLATVYHEYGITSDQFSFMGRLSNFYYFIFDLFRVKYWYIPRQEQNVRKYFKDLPEPVPTLEELTANASLVLMNTHFSIDTPAAYLPNFIEVGGLNHVKSKKPLPKDLQDILDNAKQGVVFLSFGSKVKSVFLDQDKLLALFKVFGELKQTVLMKWENSSQPHVPKNVILREWFPQRDVLDHQNIKLFIGHGGYIGLQETVAAGVPILGVPIYGDQYLNIIQAQQQGFGRLIEYRDINENNLRTIVNEMLSDKRYLEKAKEISVRYKDRPMSGLDTAVWWIEYVIRHKGAVFIKTPALKMSFYEYHMLDVYLFVLVLLLLPLIVFYKIVNFLKSYLKKESKTKQKYN